MYAVVQIGSSQFKVKEGDVINAPFTNKEKGSTLILDKILMFSDGSKVDVGQPYLSDVKVTAELVKQTASPKIVSLKYRRRKNSAVKKGHRQKLTSLNITKISG